MKPIATIRHNHHNTMRVTLYHVEGDQLVWAAAPGETPYRTDTPIVRVPAAWSGIWDYQIVEYTE